MLTHVQAIDALLLRLFFLHPFVALRFAGLAGHGFAALQERSATSFAITAARISPGVVGISFRSFTTSTTRWGTRGIGHGLGRIAVSTARKERKPTMFILGLFRRRWSIEGRRWEGRRVGGGRLLL